MSDTNTFENEGGAVGQEEYNYSPAAGLGNDTVEVDAGQPEDDADEEPASGDEVEVTLVPHFRGVYNDRETGIRFRRGQVESVSADDAERLLGLRRGGKPVFVRADF